MKINGETKLIGFFGSTFRTSKMYVMYNSVFENLGLNYAYVPFMVEDIKKGAVGEGMQSKDVLLCDKPQDIFSIITLFCKAGDAVLLEGRVPEKLVKFLVVNVKINGESFR